MNNTQRFLNLTLINHSVVKFECDDKTLKLIDDKTSYLMDNWHIVKNKLPRTMRTAEQGTVHLIDVRRKLFHVGLLLYIVDLVNPVATINRVNPDDFAKLFNFKLKFTKDDIDSLVSSDYRFSLNDKGEFYDYQYLSLIKIMQYKKGLIFLHPGAGKTMVIYLAIMYLREKLMWKNNPDKKIMVVLSGKGLINQLYDDFSEISEGKLDNEIAMFSSNAKAKFKDSSKQIFFITRSSLTQLTYFDLQYLRNNVNACFVDEVHELETGNKENFKDKKAPNSKTPVRKNAEVEAEFYKKWQFKLGNGDIKPINMVMANLFNCEYKIGLSGSIEDITVPKANLLHYYSLSQYFGKELVKVPYEDSIAKGRVVPFYIETIFFDYKNEIDTERDTNSNYQGAVRISKELNQKPRLITYMLDSGTINRDDNSVFIFFELETLYNYEAYIKEHYPDINVFVMVGQVSDKKRREITKFMKNNKKCMLLGTYKTVSTGLNIKSLDNTIMVDGIVKDSLITQMIGRSMRLYKGKSFARLLILADYARNVRGGESPLMKQAIERFNTFISKNWEFKVTRIDKDFNRLDTKLIDNKIRKMRLNLH